MLFLRGLRWRRGYSAAVLIVGVISAAVAALGPLYARAASESTLTDELRAGGSQAGLAFSSTTLANNPAALSEMDHNLGSAEHVQGYRRPVHGESTLVTAKNRAGEFTTPSTMVWREGQCQHIVLTTGHCPMAAGQALVPDDTLHSAPRWSVGDELTIHQGLESPDGFVDGPVIGHARIVGGYRPRDFAEAYWFGHGYFQSALGPGVTSVVRIGADAIFVRPAQFLTAPSPPPGSALPVVKEVDVDAPLAPTQVRLDDVPALRARVAAVQRRFPRETNPPSRPVMRTSLAHVLADAARDKRQVEAATLVVVLELAALSLLVLFQVVGGAVEARGDEIALAKLRGLPPRRTVWFALAEPVTLLLLAAPLGFLSAFAVTHLLAGSALVAGTPVGVTAASLWALGAAFAGSAVAAGLAAARTVTRPVLEQWRSTAPARHSARWLLALDVSLAIVAVAVVVALRAGNSDRPRPVFLLAPALIVFAVALVGVRLLPRLAGRLIQRTRSSKHIASFLALRQTVRRPGGLRLAALLAVAAGLATFAVCGEAVARANRDARAQTELGSARQLGVQFESGHDPQGAVADADPGGRWAMATATWSPDGGPSSGSTIVGKVQGVEPSRLAATTYAVRGHLSPASLARSITTSGRTPATFRGTQLRVTLDTTALSGDHPMVELDVRKLHEQAKAVRTSVLRMGSGAYTARVDCAAGCAFAGLTFDRTFGAQDLIAGAVTVRAVETDAGRGFTPVRMRLGDPAAWRSAQIGVGASLRLTAGGPGSLSTVFRATGGSSPVLDYADSPTTIPLVAAPKATTDGRRRGGVNDYSGAAITYDIRRFVSPLPAVLDHGAVADLNYLRTRLPNFDHESSWSVWLGPHAPADAVARLKRAGLIVQNERSAAARVDELSRQGPALGLLLLLVCAIAAAVLAVGGTAVALLADARRRSFELAALRVVGVPHKTLSRSAVVEQCLLLGAGVLLGLPSGYVAAALVLPVVPEFSDATPVVLRYGPPVLIALACAAAFAVLLTITAMVAGRALARAAVPARLREAAR